MKGELNIQDTHEIEMPKESGYKEIKPLRGTSVSEARNGLRNQFVENTSQPSSEKVYYDDNGEVYQKGNSLEPNKTFEKDSFEYKTDDQGRVISASGKLEVSQSDKNRSMPDMDAVGKGDQKEGDVRFHLIGHRFGGSDGLENLVAGDSGLNLREYKKLENTLASAVNDGCDVRMKVEPIYSNGSNRPSEIRVTYSIDGEKDSITFKNGSD